MDRLGLLQTVTLVILNLLMVVIYSYSVGKMRVAWLRIYLKFIKILPLSLCFAPILCWNYTSCVYRFWAISSVEWGVRRPAYPIKVLWYDGVAQILFPQFVKCSHDVPMRFTIAILMFTELWSLETSCKCYIFLSFLLSYGDLNVFWC